jgi:hypothetical protein
MINLLPLETTGSHLSWVSSKNLGLVLKIFGVSIKQTKDFKEEKKVDTFILMKSVVNGTGLRIVLSCC